MCAALCKGMDADHDISRGELNDNNSTACLLYNFSQHEYSVIGPTFIVTRIVGLLSSMAAIVLVLVTRSYLVTIYRIILYLSIAALLFVIGSGVVFIPYVLQEPIPSIYNKIVVSLTGYLGLVYALVLCWIGVHVFLLAVCRVRLQETKHELFAIAGVLLLPLIVSWAIPVYASGPCTFNLTVALCGFLVPYVISTILAVLTVISVILSLCKGLLKIKKVNRRALKELAPYLLFIIIQNINSILLLTDYALVMKKERMEKIFVFKLIETLVFAVSIISIPLLLLSQPHIRSRLKNKMCHCKCGGKEEGILPTTTQQRQTTVEQSATKPISVSSQTQYCVPPETSFTEEEPLIIKQ